MPGEQNLNAGRTELECRGTEPECRGCNMVLPQVTQKIRAAELLAQNSFVTDIAVSGAVETGLPGFVGNTLAAERYF
jgi:hypothetical protein